MASYSLARNSFVLLLIFMTSGCFATQPFAKQEFELNNKVYLLEIADTDERKRQGLMHRQKLEQNAGMLFVYNQPGYYRIWMKNTLIPLTVIWLDEQAIIIDMKILQPCKTENCPVSGAPEPSKYIIELHPSEFGRFQVNDRLPGILQR